MPEGGEGPKSDSAIYQSIAAVPQRSDVEPVQGGTARLFYGPACEYLPRVRSFDYFSLTRDGFIPCCCLTLRLLQSRFGFARVRILSLPVV